MSILMLDARWRRFNDPQRVCPISGRQFSGIFDLGFDQPEDWPHGPRGDQDLLEVGQDRLTGDLCRLDGRYFLRGTIYLPVRGADDSFAFGAWAEVSFDTFKAYLETFETADAPFANHEAMLATPLPGFDDSLGATLTLSLPDPDQRPAMTAQFDALAEAQEDGISFDDLLDIYALSGDDIRPFLTQD
ncbi:MAG: DUF2199 domain-containing protein [Pelagimonas sp.]|jgi:hypothetical protein|nr:DUF2199 domain-containing protein [Pelagimonas sp.]